MIAEALSSLGGAALTVVTCYAVGKILLARLGITLPGVLIFLVGAACTSLLVYCTLLARIPAYLVLAAVLFSRPWKKRPRFWWSWPPEAFGYAAIFAAFAIFYFVNALAPEASADGSGYHLEFVRRYLDAHRFIPIPTNMYSGFGEGAEMLYLLAFAIGGHSAPALVHFAFAVAIALALLSYGIRIGKLWVGAGAALLVFVSPVVGKDASSAYIDVALAAVAFAVFYCLEIWDQDRDSRMLIVIGLLAGYACAIKLPGAVLVLYSIAFVLWRRSRQVWWIATAAALMILPWMIKDWIYLGDPIAPFGAAIFRNPNVHVAMLKGIVAASHGAAISSVPLELTVRGDGVEGLLGPVFLLAPLALLALRQSTGRRLLLAALVVTLPFIFVLHARYLIPALPFISLAMLLPLADFPRATAAVVMFHALTSWPTSIRSYSGADVWKLTHFPLAAALRRESEDGFLRRSLPGYAEARMIEDHVPQGARVLTMSGLATSYTSREVLVAYQGALNQRLADSIYMGWNGDLQPKAEVVFRFPEKRVSRLRISNLNGAHEVRVFRGGSEIVRSPAWRVRAWPNPWEVGLAFDNSPATRWQTWEESNSFVEIDFGASTAIDEVRIATSISDARAPVRLDGIAAQPEVRELRIASSLRRAATYEMHSAGVDYLLIRDRDFGARDFEEDPASWGLAVVARGSDVTLYRVEMPVSR